MVRRTPAGGGRHPGRRHSGAALLDPYPRAGRPAPDPDILRTIKAHADHCLGVYAIVEASGTLAEGDVLEFEPPRARSALAQTGATALKRGVVRVFNSLLPRGE